MRNTALATRIEGLQQTDRPQYPRPALREALVNAVAHRDYSLEGAQILLYVFDDRVEIRSPGGLPNSVTLENIRAHYSKPRNETIARVLFNLGYVNTLGSGVPRMIRLMREYVGREPDFETHAHQFLVRLWGMSPGGSKR
ncbi:MAG TPA: ATP-binding protein [Anaerolineae bacterium]|nr:ATP-binding protein [Anaerolineae bacterium]HQI83904.1 ATP-binding protein [Anaerolineae bacterium]